MGSLCSYPIIKVRIETQLDMYKPKQMKMKLLPTFILLLLYTTSFAQINETLLASIKAKDVEKIDSLITSGVDIEAVDEHGANALMWACYYGDSTCVAMLFENGAKPPEEGGGIYYKGQTELYTPLKGWYGDLVSIAAGQGNLEVLNYLLKIKKMDVNMQVPHPTNDTLSLWTPLMHAVQNDQAKIVKCLLLNGVIKTNTNKINQTLYHISIDSVMNKIIRNDDLKTLETYIDRLELKNEYYALYATNLDKAYEVIIKHNAKALEIYSYNHYKHVFGLEDSATYFRITGKYNEAKRIMNEVVSITSKTQGKNSLVFASQINNTGLIHDILGEFEEALKCYKIAAPIYKQNVGASSSYATSISNMGVLYRSIGEYRKALTNTQAALIITRETLGASSLKYAIRCNNLASLYQDIGEYDLALPLFFKATEITKNKLGEQHYKYGLRLRNLAKIYTLKDRLTEAEALYKQSLEIFRKNFGEEHRHYEASINALASFYNIIGKTTMAIELKENCLEINEKLFGKMNNRYADNLSSIGTIYEKTKEWEKAKFYLQNAISTKETIFGANYQNISDNYLSLLNVNLQLKNEEEIPQITDKVIDNISSVLLNQMPFMPISLKLKWKKQYELSLGKLNSLLIDRNTSDNLYIVNSLLKNKNFIYTTKYENETRNEWYELRKKIGTQFSRPLAKRDSALLDWQDKAMYLESKLSANNYSTYSNKPIDVSNLRSALDKDEIVIDFYHFPHFDETFTDRTLYTAYIINQNSNDIKRVQLFEEKDLINILSNNKNTDNSLAQSKYKIRGTEGIVVKNKKDLSFVWKKLLPHLEGYKKIHISPSGILSKINLAAIEIDSGIVAGDRYEIYTYNNLRSILDKEQNYNNTYLLAGGIDYEYDLTKKGNSTSDLEALLNPTNNQDIIKLRAETGDRWEFLDGTQKEVDNISSILKYSNFSSGHLLSGKAANEKEIKSILSRDESPRIVHFSTHGFFFPDLKLDIDNTRVAFRSSENPMIRSGLILAGANYAWQGNLVEDDQEDGILTAYEIQNLNLQNTELVVLSACETGLGDIQGSEGVFGLQRAFKIAGAKYIIMSLWKVPDQPTEELMTSFYSNWLKDGMSIPDAFNLAQKTLRTKYPNHFEWAGFVLIQ